MARRKTLFDDRPVEISELTYIIKHDIASLNRQLAELQRYAGPAQRNARQKGADEHRGNVVAMLQTNLATTTTSFQESLEVRTQNMKASKDRYELFFQTPNPVFGEQKRGSTCVLRTDTRHRWPAVQPRTVVVGSEHVQVWLAQPRRHSEPRGARARR